VDTGWKGQRTNQPLKKKERGSLFFVHTGDMNIIDTVKILKRSSFIWQTFVCDPFIGEWNWYPIYSAIIGS